MQGVVIPISMIPGNSIIHRMNPLPKLMWTVGVLAVSFSTRNPAVLGAVFVLGLLLVLIAQVGSAYLKVVMVLLPVSLALITLQSIAPAFPRPWTPIIGWGPFTVYQEGIYSGISMALRIFSLTTWAMVFIMTSHPSDIFTSLKRVGMPYTLNFILIMTLQLIPILQNEFVVVLNAQKSRAMKGTGFGALLPSMVPVFVGAIERIQQLSISLESRAFGSSGHKTSYRRVRITVWDILNLLLAVVVSGLATYWVIVDKSLDWSRTLVFNPVFSAILIGISVTGFLTYMGLAIYLVAKS
ncbi:MAG TPA: energy-coupling factor transporter transmembrane component T [Brevefilum fermentans]|jgi:energy-coupling factor transport system permease protein|uniref:Putative ABC-type cobalt transport system permease component CbiQ n=1 Tax=Candidatus Brevifilum fermentans TaxID=1986204 RepID=A0A1Y6K1F4_9CHLR|nr:energy-coupling factor transporter transmembrane component T [Brevefilum fermentans]MDI9565305.1 energy-coupling factor transporter transmembrane component T [Chloroflexota bacterium]OQB87308.1 MAG: Energy-coupling factor transporter transmembrane protein EcfT [Chloroflexi bacterium ADurb.Bin120]SMX53522.1 putative ABC-type cobalt transport system permease component CbiQ [Brevefilum fermentans]HOM67961.1 energy-coupling factor transporter transmembrane component T [Brevefilum fermentans]HPX